jgi:hypothetical protein
MSKVKARVLMQFFDNGVNITPNTLIIGDEAIISALSDAGTVDSHAKAVGYCKDQKPVEIVGDGVDFLPEKAGAEKAAAIEKLEANIKTLEEVLAKAPDAEKKKAQEDLDAAKAKLEDLQK